jgi:predicted O-methyltransferase YrrM
MIASTPIVANQINDSFDMIFLDGDHTYEVVKEDLKASLKLLNPGGVIVFHDAISWSGVARLMREQKANYKIRVSGHALNVVGKAIANKGMDGIAVLET